MGRFNATIKDEHAQLTTDLFNTVNGGRLPGPQMIKDFGDFAGAVNYWKANQDKFVPVPIPGPTPADPLADFNARAKVGQLCAWALCTDAEATALKAIYGYDPVVTRVQFYGASGGGGVNVNEVKRAASPSGYAFWSIQAGGDPVLVDDVNGAGDKYVQWLCAQLPARPVPAPLS
jgi:hypothetical protein